MEISKEILCIPGKTKNYAVEFTYIKEICSDILVSKVPCLPEHFVGVFQYQGVIVPVIRLEEDTETPKKHSGSVILILEYQKYQLGIWLSGNPHIVRTEEMTLIEMPEQEDPGSDIWIGKAFYDYNGILFSLGDIERLMAHLIIYNTN